MLKEDVMAPVSTGGPARISPMTLAVFEDSGWYTPNYTMGAKLAKGAWFAHVSCFVVWEWCSVCLACRERVQLDIAGV